MGESNRTAVAPVTEPAPPPPPPPAKPKKPPVKTRARLLRKLPQPKYTMAAKRAGVEGKVVLRVLIDKKGRVTKVIKIKGLGYGLDERAMAAVKKWTYAPATLDGRPIPGKGRVEVEFILED